MIDKPLVETWEIHNRINIYLLDALDESMLGSYSASKGRSVGEQFAHIHNVRLMWLKSAAPELLRGLEKVEKEKAGYIKALRKALVSSGQAIGSLLAQKRSGRWAHQGVQASRVWFLGIHDFARVTPSRPNCVVVKAGRSSTRQESSVWSLGMGSPMTASVHYIPKSSGQFLHQ